MTFTRALFGDCLDVMASLPAGSIHMVLCDLPYGTTRNKWDSVVPLDRLWAQYKRICRGAIVLTAMQPFTSALIMSNPGAFRHDWTWEKNKATGHLNAKRQPMRAHEDVLVFSYGKVVYNPQMTEGHAPANSVPRNGGSSNYGKQTPQRYYGGATVRYPRSVQRFDIINNDDPEKWHPTQKPVALFEYLIRTYSNEGDVVLDNTAGSGTTAIAARNCGRNAIVIEGDPETFARMQDRIAAPAWAVAA